MKRNLLLGFVFGAISATYGYVCAAWHVAPLANSALCAFIYLSGFGAGVFICRSTLTSEDRDG